MKLTVFEFESKTGEYRPKHDVEYPGCDVRTSCLEGSLYKTATLFVSEGQIEQVWASPQTLLVYLGEGAKFRVFAPELARSGGAA